MTPTLAPQNVEKSRLWVTQPPARYPRGYRSLSNKDGKIRDAPYFWEQSRPVRNFFINCLRRPHEVKVRFSQLSTSPAPVSLLHQRRMRFGKPELK